MWPGWVCLQEANSNNAPSGLVVELDLLDLVLPSLLLALDIGRALRQETDVRAFRHAGWDLNVVVVVAEVAAVLVACCQKVGLVVVEASGGRGLQKLHLGRGGLGFGSVANCSG